MQRAGPALAQALVAFFALVAFTGPPPAAAADLRPSLTATRVASPIRVDGRLEEEPWQRSPAAGLRQREPVEDQPATETTEVRVLYDDQAIYFGIICRDRTPSAIVATQLTRDADLEMDDNVFIVLDPFFDHRNGFFFQVNPIGARRDGQVANNSEEPNGDWDGIWDAAARITDTGWVAEIAVPFKTLRFKPGQATWGLNVERSIKRKNEVDRWASPRQNVWIANLSEAGRLEGLAGIHQGRGLDVRPYVSGGEENSDGRFAGGLDVFKNLTPNMNAAVTVNTDFAETEVDARQINLTRFPLFFPEKRAFFLEGGGVFDVYGAGYGGYHSPDVVPFFTRRIGLLSSEQVPITVGAKIVGRQGDYNVGILDVQTRHTADLPDAGQNLLAARVSRNLFRQSAVGVILTHGDPTGQGSNTLVGADARLATSSFLGNKNVSLSVYALRTTDERTATSDYAGGFSVDYPNDRWDLNFGWKQIGDDFHPALGFVPREGIRKTSGMVAFQPRTSRYGLRQFFFSVDPTYVTDLHNRVLDWNIGISPFNLETASGERFELQVEPQMERLDEPFEIMDGVVVPTGSYQVTRYNVEVSSADKRPWVAQFEVSWGGFYDGTRRDVSVEVGVKAGTHLSIEIGTERNDVSLRAATFTTQVYTGRINYNLSPDVSWATLLQYDNESRVLGVQSRFRWILRPGNDLFLVLNRGWYRDLAGRYTRAFDKGSAKLQYTFRL